MNDLEFDMLRQKIANYQLKSHCTYEPSRVQTINSIILRVDGVTVTKKQQPIIGLKNRK